MAPAALWVNINPDDPYNLASRGASNKNITESLTFYDAYCIWSRTIAARLKADGCSRVLYLPFGYDEKLHVPQPISMQDMGGEHVVRCFLYQDAKAKKTPTLGNGQDRMLQADRPPGDTVIELVDYKVWFPIRKGVLQRTVDFVKAVDGVSFKIAAGRTLALVGESGSGKTTVGKALLQLLRSQAKISGSALLHGQSLDESHGEALRTARRSTPSTKTAI